MTKKYFTFSDATKANQSLEVKKVVTAYLQVEKGEPDLIQHILEKMRGDRLIIHFRKNGFKVEDVLKDVTAESLFLEGGKEIPIQKIARIERVELLAKVELWLY
ncbi:MAG: hypothetical protein V1892_03625 [bacterium]